MEYCGNMVLKRRLFYEKKLFFTSSILSLFLFLFLFSFSNVVYAYSIIYVSKNIPNQYDIQLYAVWNNIDYNTNLSIGKNAWNSSATRIILTKG